MMSEKKSSNRKKVKFEGVSPDLLRATVPDLSPKKKTTTSPLPKRSKDPSFPLQEFSSLENPAPQKRVVWGGILGPRKDPYGLRKGKDACLRSVLQRLRSGHMSAIEESRAMSFLIENQVVQNQAELAQVMTKPKSKISEKLSILKLPRSVQVLMDRHPSVITSGHAIELLRLKDPALITSVATRILEQKLSRDRLRTEISFLLDKHGVRTLHRPKRKKQSLIRYFPKVDGGFDIIYRFRRNGEQAQLEKMISHMETKLKYLKQVLSTQLFDQKKGAERENHPKPTSPEATESIPHVNA